MPELFIESRDDKFYIKVIQSYHTIIMYIVDAQGSTWGEVLRIQDDGVLQLARRLPQESADRAGIRIDPAGGIIVKKESGG